MSEAVVLDVVRNAGSSFYWAMRLLPRERRQAMYAVYAFCRIVDDIADGPLPAAEKRDGLAHWRREVERLYDGRPPGAAPGEPVARALARPVAQYGLAKGDFLAVIDGMEMDAAGPIVAPPWAELRQYCACVAGAVGLISVRIFGTGEAEGRRLASALGEAVQLTNILRDLAEDAGDGRLYLPREELVAHGVPPGPPALVLAHPGLVPVCRAVAAVARARFDEATRLLAAIPREAGRPARIMLAVYSRLLERMERRGFDRLEPRVRLSRAERLWLAIRHSWF